jgi:hypothetical protein
MYPFDDDTWHELQDVSVDEVALLFGIPEETRARSNCEQCRNMEPAKLTCYFCERTGRAPEYLWADKGYIILGIPRGVLRKILPGMQAIYLHNGKYSIIEYLGVTT